MKYLFIIILSFLSYGCCRCIKQNPCTPRDCLYQSYYQSEPCQPSDRSYWHSDPIK